MKDRKLAELSDEELLQHAKKMKSESIINALLIGILVGVIAYSIFKNTWGLVTVIPLYIIYKLANTSKYSNRELEETLKARNLK